MDSDVTNSADYYKLLAWFEVNKKQVIVGTGAAIFVGVVVWFFVYQHQQKLIRADEALSAVYVPQMTGAASRTNTAEGFLQVANNYPSAPAAARATLLAATGLFVDGKFSDAHKQFEKLARDYRDSGLVPEAQLGIAACLDAQGKTNEAITAYQTIIDRRSADNVIKPAKFSLARLYEAQGNSEKAFNLFEDLARTDPYSSYGSEAGMRSEELKIKFPNLVKVPQAPTNTMSAVAVVTNAPGTAAPKK
jgi:tetratricopeptide (TPR) repeat protein